jgi:hypothetical protein
MFYQGKKPFMLLTMEPNQLMTGHNGLLNSSDKFKYFDKMDTSRSKKEHLLVFLTFKLSH